MKQNFVHEEAQCSQYSLRSMFQSFTSRCSGGRRCTKARLFLLQTARCSFTVFRRGRCSLVSLPSRCCSSGYFVTATASKYCAKILLEPHLKKRSVLVDVKGHSNELRLLGIRIHVRRACSLCFFNLVARTTCRTLTQ